MQALIRPYRASDAPAVADLLTNAAQIDPSLVATPLAEWRAFAGASFNRGARDFAVAQKDGVTIALLMSALQDDTSEVLRNVRVIVHPHHRRRGIATALLERLAQQDAGTAVTVQAACPAAWTVGRDMLRRRGFESVRKTLMMELDQDIWLARRPHVSSHGARISTYGARAEEDKAWIALHDSGYQESPEYSALTFSDLATEREAPGFALWLAWDGPTAVGFCHVNEFGGCPCVNSLAVGAASRRRGLGRTLLLHALGALAGEQPCTAGGSGLRAPRLSVRHENEGAVTLYEEVGFRTYDTVTTYWLRPSD